MISTDHIYKRVMQEIKRSRHTVRHVCKEAGVSEAALKTWGQGVYPSMPCFIAIADAIGITPSELLMDDPYKV